MVQRFIKPGDIYKKIEFSSQKPDGRNESKKMMKKSLSFKLCDVGSDLKGFELMKKPKAIHLSDVDGLVSLPHNHVQQLTGNSSTSHVSNALPNYMKPTRSSGAKNDVKVAKKKAKNLKPDHSGRCLMKINSVKLARNLTKSSSFIQISSVKKKTKPVITSSKDTRVRKPTCSSRLKDYKFPSHVMIEAGGTESNGASKMEVCTYKYCSLNGHCHTNPQPLKSFISDRRRALKQQENLKVTDDDDGSKKVPFRGGNEIKEEEDCFIDVELEGNNLLSTEIDAECDEELYETIWAAYEKEIEELEYIEAQMVEEVYIKIENEEHFDHTIYKDVADICNEDVLEGCYEHDECSNSYNCQSQNSEQIEDTVSSYTEDLVDKEMVFAEDEATAVRTEEKQNAEDDQMEDKCQTDQNVFASEISETGMSGIKITKGKGAEEEESDCEKDFNPQEPNYLPLEEVPKGEQVDLKHQDIDERKNSEEWMVDYALQKTVTKLAPVKRKKVELLVEAFESVAPY